MNNVQRGFAATLALLTILAACGDDDSESSARDPGVPAVSSPAGGDRSIGGADDEVATEETTPAAVGGGSPSGGPSPGGGPTAGSTPAEDPLAGRSLVIRMTIGIEVADVGVAVDQVIGLAADHGAALFDSSVRIDGTEGSGGDLVFKVPPEEVDGFLTGLDPAVGTRVLLEGDTEDVTRQLTDLDAQILTAVASVERVRALLEDADDLGEVVMLEGELTARQTHLEQLLAQKAGLADQVALATITVRLSQAPEPVEAPDEPVVEDDRDGIGEAFRKGWDAFVKVIVAIALFVGYTAPFLVLGLLGLLVLRAISRRQGPRSRSAAPPHPPAPAEDPRTSEPDSATPARIP